MSEQQIQNSELSKPVFLGENFVYNLGATTLSELKTQHKINTYGASMAELRKKPDGLVVAPNKDVIIYAEYKTDEKFKSDADKRKAIDQELQIAKAIHAKIFLTKDSGRPIWINPSTGNVIKNEHGNELSLTFDPANNEKSTLNGINRILSSINETNDSLFSLEVLNPKELAKNIHQKLYVTKGISPSTALYTFVELFLFKYLSDLNILTGKYSFKNLYSLYSTDGYTTLDVLKEYLSTDNGPRRKMKELFPENIEDHTSIINGNVFHEDIGDADTFKKILDEFAKYEKENGKFERISKDFKSQLFESFLKSDNDTKKMGQYFTPLKIVDEMVRMVDIKDGMSICDPACGVGKFLLEVVADKINTLYSVNDKEFKQGITLKGYDKYSEDNGDKTIILAKANAVVYFSKFLAETHSEAFVKKFANDFLNESFILKKSSLGTLDTIETNKYDLILANPPYIVNGSGDIKELATGVSYDSDGNEAKYECGGLGIESLFMEWIVKALKENGTANVVIPDGLLSNMGNKKLKQFIKNNCYIKSIISLPTKAFFNTPKKTYIITLQKKTIENDSLPEQTKPVFAYICNSIGESLDVYRFDIPENDLKNAVSAYNLYRNSDENIRKTIPFLQPCDITNANSNLHFKEINISELTAEKSWIIEDWWNNEEKVALGLSKEQKTKTVDEFMALIDDTVSLLDSFKGELECLK